MYDEIGNLIEDKAEQITNIKWSVYGKILEISRNATPKVNVTNIKYTYDALGNRISKEYDLNGTKQYFWYVRDAQGNLLGTYKAETETVVPLASLDVNLVERHIYGSSRLGMYALTQGVDGGPADMQYYTTNTFTRGRRQYELSNHLGNVLITLSDRKFGVSSGGSLIDYYEPDMLSGNDYYPFGMLSRVATSYTGTHYRFGFNGHEHHSEIKGWQNMTHAKYWEYDVRIGRRWNLDPRPTVGLSAYGAFANNPIWFSDVKGDTVRGASSSDAAMLRDDIKSTLVGKNFKKVRRLIKIDKDKVSIAAISNDDLNTALTGIQLSGDEAALLSGIVNTINSKEVHFAEYKDIGDMMSVNSLKALELDPTDPNRRKIAAVLSNNMSVDDIPKDQIPAGYLKLLGGAATGKFGTGSYSIILKNPEQSGSGYFSIKDNKPASAPGIRPTMHEIFGHGRLIALGITNQHKQVIQFENLQLRVMGFNLYRDGSNHNIKPGEIQVLSEEERKAIPEYLKKQ